MKFGLTYAVHGFLEKSPWWFLDQISPSRRPRRRVQVYVRVVLMLRAVMMEEAKG